MPFSLSTFILDMQHIQISKLSFKTEMPNHKGKFLKALTTSVFMELVNTQMIENYHNFIIFCFTIHTSFRFKQTDKLFNNFTFWVYIKCVPQTFVYMSNLNVSCNYSNISLYYTPVNGESYFRANKQIKKLYKRLLYDGMEWLWTTNWMKMFSIWWKCSV